MDAILKSPKIVSLVFLCAFSAFSVAEAALDFSIVPVNGGSTLRFSRADLLNGITKEVRVRITSSDNVQYQIFQQLISPLANERGVTIDRPALTASILPGGSGTAYLSNFEPINRGEQLLYTSSPNGSSESFTLIYKVDPQYLSDSGTFNGLVQYSLRPTTGGQRQIANMNVFIDSTAELKLDVEGSTAKNLVRLETRENSRPAFVNLSYNGNTGGILRVYQEVLSFPINELNYDLGSGILTMVSEGGQNGSLSYQSVTEIPRGRTLIYKSTQQSDSFSIRYTLASDKLAVQPAGNYRGVVRFTFETDRSQENFDIDLDIKISPIFEISLNFPQGSINFNSVLPGSKPQIKEVDVEVRTNLRRPYVVNQKVAELLTDDRNHTIPKEHFVVREELDPGSRGRPASTEFVPVEPSETPIFYSDKTGSPTKFKVYYRLSPFEGMNPGDYRTGIVYGLGEL